jgi:peroxiredoxin
MKFSTAALLVASSVVCFAETPPVPRIAKELTILESNGKTSKLSDYRGKVCIIQFLFTTCPHCQALSRELTKLQRDPELKGLQVLGVAFDEATAEKAGAYVRQFGVGFPVGYTTRDIVLNYLGISVMNQRFVVPQVMVIDQKGMIRAQSDPMGTEELYNPAHLKQLVSGLLKSAAPAAPSAAPKAPPANKENKKS